MTMRPQTEARAVTGAYRAANDALDEHPGEAARSAIRAAAARAVAAKPHAVGTPLRRWRMPLAAAATVLISTVAVIVAQLAQQEPMTIAEGSPPPPVRPGDAGAAKPAAPDAIAHAPAVTEEAAREELPAPRAVRSRSAATARSPAREPAVRADAPAAAATGPSASADAQIAAPAQAPPSPQTAADTIGGQAAVPATAGAPVAQAQPRAVERRATPAATGEIAPATLPSMSKANSPERWLARIVELRQAGRDDEADTELKKLRERHPALAVPATALRRTATR